MIRSSRFDCASSSLGLNALLTKTKHVLWSCFALGILAHLSLGQIQGTKAQERAAKPLTTQFVKREPRLTKPLELKKRPQPRRRQAERKMVAVKAREAGQGAPAGLEAVRVVGSFAGPSARVGREVGLGAARMEPETVAQQISGVRQSEHVVDMALELVDLEALDTGRHQALVVEDPQDKRNIKGFVRLRLAYSESMQKRHYTNFEDRIIHGLVTLVESMNQYTQISAKLEGRVPFTSSEMAKTPWVYCSYGGGAEPFVFPEAEAASLGRYLTSGGFLLFDVLPMHHGQRQPPIYLTCVRSNLKAALATQNREEGRDWTYEMLSSSHPIYHCYFDFDDAPAGPWDQDSELAGKLQGVRLDGQWVLALSAKWFIHMWGDPDYPELRSERMIQFGINTIIFALTQEGSITTRLMDDLQF